MQQSIALMCAYWHQSIITLKWITPQITDCQKLQSEAAQFLAVRVNLPC